MSWIWLFTIAWGLLALAYPLLHEHLGGLYFGTSSLGETGDFLSGWLTPLAFLWFVVAVFLQRAELKRQREELELMRKEYAESRKVAEDQASHLRASSLVGARQVFMEMLDDSQQAMTFNAYKLHEHMVKFMRPQTGADFIPFVYGNHRDLLDKNAQALQFLRDTNTLNRVNHSIPADAWVGFIQLLHAMVQHHNSLKSEAARVELLEYYMYMHQNSQIGEIVRSSDFILQVTNSWDD
jgi:hypothetical protein